MSELKNNSCSGFTLLELILSVCIIGFMVVVAIKNRGGSHTSPANACINNLRQIAVAADQFAKEKGLKAGDKINFPNDLTPYIKLNNEWKIPPCPSGGIDSLKKIGDSPICSLGTTVTPAHVLP